MAYNLRPLWDAILALYGRFDAYCKEYGLRYYVTGGTLLGAVRHNGFIPWDDDFDVVMPRPDYIRFIECIRKAPIRNSRLVTMDTDPRWGQYFAKLVETDCNVVDDVQRGTGLSVSDGICVDVIPIDGMPKATIPFYFWALKRSTWRHSTHKNPFWRVLLNLLWPKGSPEAFERWLASYDYDTSPCVEDYNANGRRFKMRCLSAASFGEPIMHQFENINVPLPREWDKFLRCIFGGDYMTPPPQEAQVPSHQAIALKT